MVEQLGDQSTYGCSRKVAALVAPIASSLSSIEAAKEENLKDIRDHQALLYVSAFLRKKYEASRQTLLNRAQLEMHVAELNHGSYYVAPIAVTILKIYRFVGENTWDDRKAFVYSKSRRLLVVLQWLHFSE